MSRRRRILFVCLHGAAKSVLAAADCERLAAARGLDIAADFASSPTPTSRPLSQPGFAPRVWISVARSRVS